MRLFSYAVLSLILVGLLWLMFNAKNKDTPVHPPSELSWKVNGIWDGGELDSDQQRVQEILIQDPVKKRDLEYVLLLSEDTAPAPGTCTLQPGTYDYICHLSP